MPAFKDVTGKQFGKWTVLHQLPNRTTGARSRTVWQCRCECGREAAVFGSTLAAKAKGVSGCSFCGNKRHGMSRDRKYRLVIEAQRRARLKGLPFEIKWRDLEIPEYCPLLGIPLRWSNGRYFDGTPSIDRLDSSKGYTLDNVWVISWRANALKKDATLTEIEMLAANLRKKFSEQSAPGG